MSKRTNTAKWIKSANRWQINVQKDGIRKTFTCSEKGKSGQIKCNAKADEWLCSGIISGSIKVQTIYASWLEEVKLLKGTCSYANYECMGRIHILPEIGKKKMSLLTEQDFQNVLNKAYKKGLSYKSLANIRGCMQTFLKYCRKNKTTSLHLEDIEISKKAPKGEKKTLQPGELSRLLTSSDNAEYWYLNTFKILALTGLRRGELIALTKADYKNGAFNINKSFNRFGELTKGKTENAIREFVLIEVAQTVMKDQLKQISALKTNYLFPNQFGEISSASSIYNQWKRFCKHHGITPISLHELRHTFISLCKNVPLELLKQVVGHSASMDTFRQYGHALDGEKELAQKLIDKEWKVIINDKAM